MWTELMRRRLLRIQTVANRAYVDTSWSDRSLDYTSLVMDFNELERQVTYAREVLVAEMRYQGCTWAEIGKILGISRQAAWERYGDSVTEARDLTAAQIAEVGEQNRGRSARNAPKTVATESGRGE